MTRTPVVYHPRFRVGWRWLSFLHPFDFERPDHVLAQLRADGGDRFELHQPQQPVGDRQLELVHQPEYLTSLHGSLAVATILEVPPLAILPFFILDRVVVTPQRYAVSATLLAARLALERGLSFTLAGGFHHAKPDRGEGFCLFSDIGYALAQLRAEGLASGPVLYIDLDAHQGNGVCHMFAGDASVRIFDIYNGDAYPIGDRLASQRIDAAFPLRAGSGDREYLPLLRRELPTFLKENPAEFVIFNAGSDPFVKDSLGGLALSAEAIFERDCFVIDSCRQKGLPVLFLPSGGYSAESSRIISRTILNYL